MATQASTLYANNIRHMLADLTPTGNSPVITADSMIVAFVFSAGVGLLAGLVPAFKAYRTPVATNLVAA